MSDGYLMDLEKLSKIYADSFRRLSEANRRPTVREAIDNFRANTAVMRNEIGNNTKEDGNMVTVKQVRDLGIELVADDIVSVDDECKSQVTFEPIGHRYIDGVNNLRFGWEYSVVKEFAPRKNEGVQPVADDVLVDAVYRDGSSKNCVRARDRYWPIDNDSSDIITWKPSFKNWENEMNDNQEIDALRNKLKLQQELLYCRKKEILDMCVTAKDQNRVSLDEVADILGVKRLTKQDKYNIVKSRNFRGKMNDHQEIKIGLTCADDEPSKLVIDAKDAIKVDLSAGSDWNGEGLPPVGFECELKYKHSGNSLWRKCKVFAYSNEYGLVAAIFHLNENQWLHSTIDVDDYEFRKPETPEQREERETISELCKLVENDEYTNSLNVNLDCSAAMRAVIDLIAKEGYRLEVKPTREEE